MLTEQERKELEALKAKEDLTADEKARLDALLLKEKGEGKTFSEDYVKGLRAESAKYRTKVRELEEKMAKFDEIDPDEYRQLKQSQKEAENKKLEEKGEFEKLKGQMVESHQKELDKLQGEIENLKQQIAGSEGELNTTILQHEIAVAAATAKAINPKLVEMVAMQQMKVEKGEDGRRVIKVLDADGNRRMDVKTGEPLTITQVIEEMKMTPDYAHLFAGGKAGGGSSTTLFDGKRIDNPWKQDSFNLTLQGKIMKDDPDMAARLKAEAGA